MPPACYYGQCLFTNQVGGIAAARHNHVSPAHEGCYQLVSALAVSHAGMEAQALCHDRAQDPPPLSAAHLLGHARTCWLSVADEAHPTRSLWCAACAAVVWHRAAAQQQWDACE